MLREWSSYGYELMGKNGNFRPGNDECGNVLPDVATNGERWNGQFQLGQFEGGRHGECTPSPLQVNILEFLGAVLRPLSENDEIIFPALYAASPNR